MISKPILLSAVAIAAVAFTFAAAPIMADVMQAHAQSNTGINVVTTTHQGQSCTSAGGGSGISGSCVASSTNTVSNTGGVASSGGSGINIVTITHQRQSCTSGAIGSCVTSHTNTVSNTAGVP